MSFRALTLHQPWAWLLVSGIKLVENRRWLNTKAPRRFWVHAGLGMPEYDDVRRFAESLVDGLVMPPPEDMARGAIVGWVELEGRVLAPYHRSPEPWRSAPATGRLVLANRFDVVPSTQKWHFPEQYGYVVARGGALEQPVPCRGAQGFWRVPPQVLAQLPTLEVGPID